MSNLETSPPVELISASAVEMFPVFEPLVPRRVVLTPRQWNEAGPGEDPLSVTRFVPTRGRRMVGAWCFVDYYGPDDISRAGGMLVPPHPHCGLQTVTWLFAGEVQHRDSVGSAQLIRPGQLNLMTAGHGISHAETSPPGHGPTLHGVQLWVVLPSPVRDRAPSFEHHQDLPKLDLPGLSATVILGELGGLSSPASAFSPLVGADVQVRQDASEQLELNDSWEYAVLVTDGEIEVDGRSIARGDMAYLGCGRSALHLAATNGGRMLLLGGEPFEEQIVMWWNFVARSHDEIAQARAEWMGGDRFGTVRQYYGQALPAPPMPPVTLNPRGRIS